MFHDLSFPKKNRYSRQTQASPVALFASSVGRVAFLAPSPWRTIPVGGAGRTRFWIWLHAEKNGCVVCPAPTHFVFPTLIPLKRMRAERLTRLVNCYLNQGPQNRAAM